MTRDHNKPPIATWTKPTPSNVTHCHLLLESSASKWYISFFFFQKNPSWLPALAVGDWKTDFRFLALDLEFCLKNPNEGDFVNVPIFWILGTVLVTLVTLVSALCRSAKQSVLPLLIE